MPLAASVRPIIRAARSFHPASMPLFTRVHYRRELTAWLFLSIMMGGVEGGVTSVMARNAFEGVVPTTTLRLAVAALAGAPAFANIASLFWSSLAQGRHKIRFLVILQGLAVLMIGQLAFAPRSGIGLAMLLVAGIGGRVLWSGVVTIRATVWRHNFPRSHRATVTGKIVTLQAVALAVVGVIIGLAQDVNPDAYRVVYPVLAVAGLVGAAAYGRVRMRRHRSLIAREQAAAADAGGLKSLLRCVSILRDDRPFARYMAAMAVFGTGNLAITAPLVLMITERFGFGSGAGILVTSTIPIILITAAIPFWSRLLDSVHIVRFRMIHAWAFIAANVLVLAAALTMQPAFIWGSAVCRGIAFGGGVLGWNLGHFDFAPPERTSEYMGVHVTLTGIRGLIAPWLAVGAYVLLENQRAGAGAAVFAACIVLNLLGVAGFFLLWRSIRGEIER